MTKDSNLYKYIKKSTILTVAALTAFNCSVTVFARNLNNFVTTSNLNLRSEPDIDSDIQEVFPMGTTVEIIEYISIEWYKVGVDDMTGYMNAEFLATEEQYEELQEQLRIQREEMLEQARIQRENMTGGVELVQWSEAEQIFEQGVPATILDVRSGYTYMVKSFSNGMHADVEPITPEDTEIMLQTFDGSWSWDCRPIIVSINGHVMAASINGMPHGGGINDSNNMEGQVCIHFQGSSTHNGNEAHESEHQSCVMEAYNSNY